MKTMNSRLSLVAIVACSLVLTFGTRQYALWRISHLSREELKEMADEERDLRADQHQIYRDFKDRAQAIAYGFNEFH